MDTKAIFLISPVKVDITGVFLAGQVIIFPKLKEKVKQKSQGMDYKSKKKSFQNLKTTTYGLNNTDIVSD